MKTWDKSKESHYLASSNKSGSKKCYFSIYLNIWYFLIRISWNAAVDNLRSTKALSVN